MGSPWNATMKWCLLYGDDETVHITELLELLRSEDNSNEESTSAVHISVLGSNTTILKYLIDYNLPLNAIDGDGATPLHWACSNGNKQAMQMLLQYGADYQRLDFDGNNILHYAVEQGRYKITKRIVSLNILNLEEQNNDGQTVLQIACKNEEKQIIKFLLNQGASILRPLIKAIKKNKQHKIVEFLLKNGNLQLASFYGIKKNPLHIAVEFNRYKMSKLLLEYYPWLLNCTDRHNKWPKDYIKSSTKSKLIELLNGNH